MLSIIQSSTNMRQFWCLIVLVFSFCISASHAHKGLEVHPAPIKSHSDSDPDDSSVGLIWYVLPGAASRPSNPPDARNWTEKLDQFLDKYQKPDLTPELEDCSSNSPLSEDGMCKTNVESMHPCTAANQYGYRTGDPCIFLSLDVANDWSAQVYKNTSELPQNMPENLKNAFSESDEKDRNTIWVSCDGLSPADKENIGTMKIIPKPGFPAYFFPHKNMLGYLSPLLAVQFASPRSGVIIAVRCQAWAKNLPNNDQQMGSVVFEFLIDD